MLGQPQRWPRGASRDKKRSGRSTAFFVSPRRARSARESGPNALAVIPPLLRPSPGEQRRAVANRTPLHRRRRSPASARSRRALCCPRIERHPRRPRNLCPSRTRIWRDGRSRIHRQSRRRPGSAHRCYLRSFDRLRAVRAGPILQAWIPVMERVRRPQGRSVARQKPSARHCPVHHPPHAPERTGSPA